MVVPSGGAGGRVEGGGGGGVSAAGSGSGGRVKGSWTPEEDDLLLRAVTRHGPRNWTVISAEIPGRSGKSCRLRWCNQLSPGVERRAFTHEEDAVIVAAHAQYGNKWATIARMLHGRTDNSVKNHWNSTLRRQRRAAAANANASASAVGCVLQLRPLAAAAVMAAPVPLRHLLDLKEAAAAGASVPFHRFDPKEVDEDEDMDDEDGSSEDSVLMPPSKKRPCAGHQHPSSLDVKPEHAKPPPPAPAPAEPLTSLTLSLPGGGGNGVGVHDETPAPQSAAASMEEGAVNLRAKLEQDPWFVPVMRQMICEEVQRQMQGMDVSCSSLVAVPAGRRSSAGGADGGGGANGQA
ncbi:transcription factor MYB77-like [Miscanthus floridulus]|uniref:transcription factor MYB77-like n=1 Tax=Miscanthus floridulus TaxID=154761 RepID=UPI003458C7FE